MTTFLPIIFAQAAAPAPSPAPAASPAGNPLITFIPLILIFAIFYFMLIRPEQRRKKEHQKLVDALKPGDRIITTGGIYGFVDKIKDKSVVVKIADNVKVEMLRGSVQTVLQKDEATQP